MAVSTNLPKFSSDLINTMEDFLTVYWKSAELLYRWFDTGVQAEVGALASDGTTVPGTPFDKATLVNAVNVLDAMTKLVENKAVTQGNYRATATKAANLKST
jgi:hypothetical protein